MNFLDRLDQLMDERSLNKNQLASLTGIPVSTIYGWYKKGFGSITLPTMQKLASFFGCSMEYLVSGTENVPEQSYVFIVSAEERKLIEKYRTLDDHGRRVVNFLLNEEAARVAALMEQGHKHLTDEEAIALVARRYGHLFNSNPNDEEKSV